MKPKQQKKTSGRRPWSAEDPSPQWSRKPADLDREDAAIQREGIAGEKPGVRPQGDADFVREKS